MDPLDEIMQRYSN